MKAPEPEPKYKREEHWKEHACET